MSDITYTRITPDGEEKCSLRNGDGMTRKEWVAKMYPVKVWEGFGGGVEGCPADYSELCEIDEHAHDCKRNCVLNGGDGCGICWNTVVVSPVNFTKVNPDDEIDSEGDAVESDAVHSPTHYCKGGIECIDAIRASMTADGFMDYCKGNVLKYIWRWRDKGGAEDLKKARVYLDWLIEEANNDH